MSSHLPELLLGERLAGRTLALAESCTGGLVAARVVSVPGSSIYFLGGVVAYANEAKRRLLGVSEELLASCGAVSPECAAAMARGARAAFGADVALATTGIAGPGGASEEKPVGLAYVALAIGDRELCRRYVWQADRPGNIRSTADAALDLLVRHLLN